MDEKKRGPAGIRQGRKKGRYDTRRIRAIEAEKPKTPYPR
jgi:hypothetical protein